MDNSTAGSRKLFLLKPAKSGLQQQQNGSTSENGNSFSVNNNPFLKCEKEKDELLEAPKEAANDTNPVEKSTKDVDAKNLFKPPSTNLFKNATTLSENSNFVFGQNLHERVVIDKTAVASTTASETETKSNDEDEKAEEEKEKSSKLLFSSVLSQQSENETPEKTEDASTQQKTPVKSDDQSDDNLSLIEAARRYEEIKSAQKRKYDEVEVITGEEDDKNIVEMNCRLFTFDKNNWEERGRGMLRLNDCKNSARVVFRASGSLRLLLNTKVWKDQLCEQANSKSLRLTAIDSNGLVKIYLVTGRIEDIDNLYHALSVRIRREKERIAEEPEEDKITKESTETEKLSNTATTSSEHSLEPVCKKIASEVE